VEMGVEIGSPRMDECMVLWIDWSVLFIDCSVYSMHCTNTPFYALY
jgi:hypothetical protein